MFRLLKRVCEGVGGLMAKPRTLTPYQQAQVAYADAYRRQQDAKERRDSRDLFRAQRDLRTAKHTMLSAEVWG